MSILQFSINCVICSIYGYIIAMILDKIILDTQYRKSRNLYIKRKRKQEKI